MKVLKMNLKKIFYLFILLIHQPYINGAKLISLGGSCTVASILREFNLRHEAYPFDWMFSSYNAVYQAIKDDFRYF